MRATRPKLLPRSIIASQSRVPCGSHFVLFLPGGRHQRITYISAIIQCRYCTYFTSFVRGLIFEGPIEQTYQTVAYSRTYYPLPHYRHINGTDLRAILHPVSDLLPPLLSDHHTIHFQGVDSSIYHSSYSCLHVETLASLSESHTSTTI